MFNDGAYHVLARNWGPDGSEHNRLLARFVIINGNVQHVDDYTGSFEATIPEGPITFRTLEALEALERSAYYKLISEDDIRQCMHPYLIQTLDYGDVQPEEKYLLSGIDFPDPQLVEVWTDAVTLAGKTLSDQEIREIMEKVKDGHYTLTPES